MRRKYIIRDGIIYGIILGIILGAISLLPVCRVEAKESGNTKIHFISLNSSTDAILLESNGQYGMVDSGEDWEYPDGSDERYPLRGGITKGKGYEQQVIHYLKSQGVEKLEFYIATHSHSDHIGSGDEILDEFPTERLYINEYDDQYIKEERRKWDNRYVYDDIIEAAKRNGTEIITDLDRNEDECFFTLGDMSLQLMNVDRKRDEIGQPLLVADENDNCIVTRITAYGRTALLTADLDPTEGDTAKIADQLIADLGDKEECQTGENIVNAIALEDSYPKENYTEQSEVELDLPETRSEKPKVDESQKNMGKTISIDLMKMLHHSIDFNNTTYFLTSLNPKTVVVTGYESWFNERMRDCLPVSELYATATDSAAVVATFHEEGIDTEYKKMEGGWFEIDGKDYYFDENGRTFTDAAVHGIDGIEYCFDIKGAVETTSRWVKVDGKWRYWLSGGEFKRKTWFQYKDEWYYLDDKGNAVTGWKWIDGKCYYFDKNGTMVANMWIGDDYVDSSGAWVKNAVKPRWIQSGNKWWYRHTDGGYTKSDWELIKGKWYYFDSKGWMQTGWKKVGGKWYYMDNSGAMQTGWEKVKGKWYYLNSSGVMQTGWEKVKGKWYYLNGSGVMQTGWGKVKSKWYYMDNSGAMQTGWRKIGGKWYYLDKINGDMKIGWLKLENKWYYLNGSGAMVVNQWVGNYYLKSNGEMAVDEWVDNGKYYVDETGKWV